MYKSYSKVALCVLYINYVLCISTDSKAAVTRWNFYLKLVCNSDAKQVSPSGVTRWNSCFYHHWDCCECCWSRKPFYFSWNLSRNESSKTFHETDHVTWCNACWNLFGIVVPHKFQLKVLTCNSGFTEILQYLMQTDARLRSFLCTLSVQ